MADRAELPIIECRECKAPWCIRLNLFTGNYVFSCDCKHKDTMGQIRRDDAGNAELAKGPGSRG